MELKATWTKLFASPEIQRSSHSVSVVGDNVLVYGGELRPREPVDSAVHIINLGNGKLLPLLLGQRPIYLVHQVH